MYNPTASRNSLVFIGSQVANVNEPSEDVASEVEVIFKDVTKNGVAPNMEVMTRHTNFSSIPIISKGEPEPGNWSQPN